MSASVVVCPHCGKRRSVVPKLQLDRDEVRALLVMEGVAEDEEERDWLATLVLPHPSTQGAARAAELALTVIGLPFVASGVVMFALYRLRKRTKIKMRGEVGPLLLMSLMGTLGLWSVLGIAGFSTVSVLKISAGFISALTARALIRARSHRATSRERQRIDTPPSARVLAPVEAPEPAHDAPPPGEQPRLLR
ncbi:MAG TPA: hypothetical protein VIV40_34490 [Kofleriaceae bacterium]